MKQSEKNTNQFLGMQCIEKTFVELIDFHGWIQR